MLLLIHILSYTTHLVITCNYTFQLFVEIHMLLHSIQICINDIKAMVTVNMVRLMPKERHYPCDLEKKRSHYEFSPFIYYWQCLNVVLDMSSH